MELSADRWIASDGISNPGFEYYSPLEKVKQKRLFSSDDMSGNDLNDLYSMFDHMQAGFN